MKSLLKSLASAFLMYSRIPVPQVEWKEENRRYSLCFFPLIGAVIGGIYLLWRNFCAALGFGSLFGAIGAALIPILVTGGIHMDGYCDATDARASYAEREKRLAIMSDPHIGSFAAIRLCVYLAAQVACFSEIHAQKTALVVSLGYLLSRAMSGIGAVTFRSAKNGGTLRNFVKPAHRKQTLAALFTVTVAVAAAMAAVFPLGGGLALFLAFLCFVYYRRTAYRDFGGITGDLAGWFLALCELAILIGAVAGERISGM